MLCLAGQFDQAVAVVEKNSGLYRGRPESLRFLSWLMSVFEKVDFNPALQ